MLTNCVANMFNLIENSQNSKPNATPRLYCHTKIQQFMMFCPWCILQCENSRTTTEKNTAHPPLEPTPHPNAVTVAAHVPITKVTVLYLGHRQEYQQEMC